MMKPLTCEVHSDFMIQLCATDDFNYIDRLQLLALEGYHNVG